MPCYLSSIRLNSIAFGSLHLSILKLCCLFSVSISWPSFCTFFALSTSYSPYSPSSLKLFESISNISITFSARLLKKIKIKSAKKTPLLQYSLGPFLHFCVMSFIIIFFWQISISPSQQARICIYLIPSVVPPIST